MEGAIFLFCTFPYKNRLKKQNPPFQSQGHGAQQRNVTKSLGEDHSHMPSFLTSKTMAAVRTAF